MTADARYLPSLITELRKLPQETGWVEFKHNNDNPDDIGSYLSALSNTAALEGQAAAFVVWGIDDASHDVIGTTFRPSTAKKSNEELESWLLRLLSPKLHFVFHELEYEGHPVVVLEIPRATHSPVQFEGVEWIRVGSYRKKLKEHPQIERELWRVFDTTPFEALKAREHAGADEVFQLLDVQGYFDLLQLPAAQDQKAALARLRDDGMLVEHAGRFDVTNLGAVLLAKKLDAFPALRRKTLRIVVYDGKARLRATRELDTPEGYAVGFAGWMKTLGALLPRREVVGQARRADVPLYPDLAVRELVANALIHQDFSITGAGPMVEVFDDRIEVTNPGQPLMKTDRLLDTPPRSRNEQLASFMRRVGICEERGSGIDKVVSATEQSQLPAPVFETPEGSTRAVLFAPKLLRDMDREERVLACYLHACLRHVQRDPMTNASLRERFGIEEHNAATASRIIRDALDDERIRPFDVQQSKRFARYLPWWA